MLELSRIITAFGAVLASTGLVIYGVAVSYVVPDDFQTDVGLWMMVLGVITTVVGLVMYRQAYLEED